MKQFFVLIVMTRSFFLVMLSVQFLCAQLAAGLLLLITSQADNRDCPFDYQNLVLSSRKFADKLSATVTITNRGKVPGREVVQLYLSAPQNKLNKPAAELRAFAKTKLLQPGESQTLQFDLTTADLSSFDPAANEWVAEAGKYRVMIGASSTDIRQSTVFRKSTQSNVPL